MMETINFLTLCESIICFSYKKLTYNFITTKMSRRRNRNNSHSISLRHSNTNSPTSQLKRSMGNTTTNSIYLSRIEQPEEVNFDLHEADQVFHKYLAI